MEAKYYLSGFLDNYHGSYVTPWSKNVPHNICMTCKDSVV